MKTCSKCKEEKLFSEFHRNRSRKDGYNHNCKTCVIKYKTLNKTKISSYVHQYYELNKDKILVYQKAYCERNKSKIAKRKKKSDTKWREANKDKCSAYSAKRRANKLCATPSWLTKEELIEIEELYEIAQAFKLYTGQDYHVDHIVPLQGKTVCGLHVPWNLQVITAEENRSKRNKLLD